MFYFIHNVLGGKTFRKRINNIGNEIAKDYEKAAEIFHPLAGVLAACEC